jgi:hypothetical protein
MRTDPGINWGSYGDTNIDRETGIRYGCISQHSILQAWADSSQPACSENCDCGEDDSCAAIENGEFYYEGDGYVAVSCLDSDVLFCVSPFYTFGPFCSPCVPGGINLDDAAGFFEFDAHALPVAPALDETCLPRAYCPGHDWFDDGRAPYGVFGAISGRQCFPDSWYGR